MYLVLNKTEIQSVVEDIQGAVTRQQELSYMTLKRCTEYTASSDEHSFYFHEHSLLLAPAG